MYKSVFTRKISQIQEDPKRVMINLKRAYLGYKIDILEQMTQTLLSRFWGGIIKGDV